MEYKDLPRIQQLVIKSLARKWNRIGDSPVTEVCPFCLDATDCFDCRCPVEICSSGFGGYISGVIAMCAGEIFNVRDLPQMVYRDIVHLFTKHLEGY